MTGANRRKNADEEARAGDDALRAAQVLLSAGLPNDAVSRAYYAAFHYARAVLFLDGLQPKTHRGTISLLLGTPDRPGRLPRPVIDELARLQTFRDVADYTGGRLSLDHAADEVAAAERFIAAARAALTVAG